MCKIDSGFYKNKNGVRLFYKQWMPCGQKLKGIIQIAHGMRESTDYYKEFCMSLTCSGYGVFIHDSRGHGRTAGIPGSIKFCKNAGNIGKNGINLMVDDLAEITDSLHSKYPEVPVFLLGHSMGSVLARLYASRYGEKIAGLIYSGTTGPADSEKLTKLLNFAEKESESLGRDAPAVETPKLLFGNFNDRFQPVKTGYEYMSRDEKMVLDAIESPFAAISYRCGFYADFLRAVQEMDLPSKVECIPKNLPIFSVSGDMDPFGNYGEGVKDLFDLYKRVGIKNASFILYHGGRHEMLRETNRFEVFENIINWLDSIILSDF